MSFDHALLKQAHYLKNIVHINNQNNDKAFVIIEPRRHYLLKPVVLNVISCLEIPSEWNLYIFTSYVNKEWVDELFDKWSINIITIPFKNINHNIYNIWLTSLHFWENIKEEHILIFQTDIIMFRKGIEEYLDYDYSGGNYYHPDDVALKIGGIQGGFSMRKRSAMIDCIKNVSWKDIIKYRNKDIKRLHEDVFFTYACEILNKKVIPIEKRSLFCIEADYYPYAISHHGTTKKYFTEEQIYTLIYLSSNLKALYEN